MTLFDKFAHCFDTENSLENSYLVRFDEAGIDYAMAEVNVGSESFFCELKIYQRRLYVSCECTAQNADEFCSHIARVLSVAQEREVLLQALKKNVAAKILPLHELSEEIDKQDLSQVIKPKKITQRTYEHKLVEKAFDKVMSTANSSCEIRLLFCLYKHRLEFFWKANGQGGYFDPRSGECIPEDLPLLNLFKDLPLLHEEKLFYVELEGVSAADLKTIFTQNQLYWRGEERKLKKVHTCEGDWHLELQGIDLEDQSLQLSLALRSSQEQLLAYEAFLPGAIYQTGQILFYDLRGAQKLVEDYPSGQFGIESKEISSWVNKYLAKSQLETKHLPEALRYESTDENVETKAIGKLYFSTAEFKVKNREMLHVELNWLYGDAEIADSAQDETLVDVKNKQIHQRDFREEKFARELLYTLGFEFISSGPELGWKLLPAKLPDVVPSLKQRKWQTLAEGKSLRVPRDFSINVSSEQDWLEVNGKFEFDGASVSLPDILKQWMNGEKFIVLDDGSLGLLPEEWLKNFTALTELGDLGTEGMRFHRQQALLVEQTLKSMEEGDCQFDYQTLSDRVDGFSSLKEREAHGDFGANLRAYQKQALSWFVEMKKLKLGACLADDMGLGKTVQVLSFLHLLLKQGNLEQGVLIVAPRSLLFNWEQEIKRFSPEFEVSQYLGAGRQKILQSFSEGQILLTTYGTLIRDAVLLKQKTFSICVADEAQAMKNPLSMTSKTMRLINADFKIAMTGTPVENNLGDLWSLFEFLNPGLLGTYKYFANIYLDGKCSAKNLNSLRQTIKPLMLRRKKSEVAKELPAKTEQVLFCDLSEEQEKIYNDMHKFYSQEKQRDEKEKPGAKGNVLAALTRLRQVVCHPCLVNEDYQHVQSGKITLLINQLEQVFLSGGKALIFSQFTRFLDLIEEAIQMNRWNYTRLDGSTKDRQVPVEEFNDNPDCRFFLISLKAGGTGLNLTQAQYVYIMDPWWNPAAESQAIDRAYRIGQEKAVSAYRIVSKNTIEDKLLNLQAKKSQLVEDVIEAGAFTGKLDQEDLKALLK
ncbi:SNF2-related protein [Lentisphaera marina]|uniref:DEAD/DEAH box helicase n=1 Tax=Lentisphaera marina TaxID=1111041 RepID=UPI0023673C43|nr:DEAD/DEAH box helicase [Lentisphaera marina]MDD7986955.1 SNF2-related protein [Lentisphaera marina]